MAILVSGVSLQICQNIKWEMERPNIEVTL